MKTKNELITNLAKVISKYNSSSNKDKLVREQMQEVYVQKRLPIRTVGLMFKGEKPLTSLSDIELGIWCLYLYDITKAKIINIDDYFTEKEQYEIKSFINNDELLIDTDEITLHNVTKKIIKGKIHYIVPFVSYYEIYLATVNSLITYNFETQRDAKLTKYQGKIIRQENVNLTSVDEISELVAEDKQPISMITWNIRQSPYISECIFYDKETKELKLKPSLIKEVFIDNIDGYHRTLGCEKGVLKAMHRNITLEGGFALQITNYTTSESQNYIHIMNKQNAIKKEQVEAFIQDDFNDFIKKLIYVGNENTNMLYNKICNTFEEMELTHKYTTVGILHDGLKLSGLNFSKPFVNENIYQNHFIEVFNTILGYYFYKYEDNITKIKEETIVLEPNIFVGYIAIAKELLNINDKKQILLNLLTMNKINLNREAFDWNSLDLYKKNPKSYKKIYGHFEKLIKEVN